MLTHPVPFRSASCALLLAGLALAAPANQPPAEVPESEVPEAEVLEPRIPEVAPSRPDIPQLDAYERRDIAGFRVLVHRSLLEPGSVDGPRVLAALTWDLELLADRSPRAAVEMLRRTTPIWVTPDLPSSGGWAARGLCHHPSREWLVNAGYGADRAGAVEVCDVGEYLLWRAEQPLCILHEMAHALQHELGDPAEIRQAFEAARDAGTYQSVPFVLTPGAGRRAYAMNNHIEYFAEISEAWFGRNDYFPFTRDDLIRADPRGAALVERIWSMPEAKNGASIPSPL